MERCKTCRHWTRPPHQLATLGACRKIENDDGVDEDFLTWPTELELLNLSDDVLKGDSGITTFTDRHKYERGVLVTRATFGCTLWEAK